MVVELYKYQAAGNDFIMIDGRVSKGRSSDYVNEQFICKVCNRRYGIGADGLIVLKDSDKYSFKMEYYNSDGTGGMMCGNGGRAIVAFAADLGCKSFDFEAADGYHDAQLLENGDVRLKMKDVSEVMKYDEDSFRLDTGTKHFVRFVKKIDTFPVVEQGRIIRYNEEFAPVGTNVNFVEPKDGLLWVRTYEKGVEDETYACGTGIVASCISAYLNDIVPSIVYDRERVGYEVRAVRDFLAVDFIPMKNSEEGLIVAKDVWLTGPARGIAKIDYFCY